MSQPVLRLYSTKVFCRSEQIETQIIMSSFSLIAIFDSVSKTFAVNIKMGKLQVNTVTCKKSP